MDMDIFSVPMTPHPEKIWPLLAQEVRHTLSLLPHRLHISVGTVLQLHEADEAGLGMVLCNVLRDGVLL